MHCYFLILVLSALFVSVFADLHDDMFNPWQEVDTRLKTIKHRVNDLANHYFIKEERRNTSYQVLNVYHKVRDVGRGVTIGHNITLYVMRMDSVKLCEHAAPCKVAELVVFFVTTRKTDRIPRLKYVVISNPLSLSSMYSEGKGYHPLDVHDGMPGMTIFDEFEKDGVVHTTEFTERSENILVFDK
uniref:Cystatin domain-containing protein n=1 Tax=Panagrellus redivivus TaxID=6233 RepID=A0A7E4UXR4_PANRE